MRHVQQAQDVAKWYMPALQDQDTKQHMTQGSACDTIILGMVRISDTHGCVRYFRIGACFAWIVCSVGYFVRCITVDTHKLFKIFDSCRLFPLWRVQNFRFLSTFSTLEGSKFSILVDFFHFGGFKIFDSCRLFPLWRVQNFRFLSTFSTFVWWKLAISVHDIIP